MKEKDILKVVESVLEENSDLPGLMYMGDVPALMRLIEERLTETKQKKEVKK